MTEAIATTDNPIAKVRRRSQNKLSALQQMLQAAEPAIARRLAGRMSAPELIAQAMTEVRANPDLMKCDAMAILGAVYEVAQCGLRLGKHLGQAWLIPYRGELQVVLGYKGMIMLAHNSIPGLTVSARCVYDVEVADGFFRYREGTEPYIKHEPCLLPVKDRGPIVAVYAVARRPDSSPSFTVMTWDEIEHARGGPARGPWKTHPQEMAKKTAIRRLLKLLPLSPEAQRLRTMDEYRDANVTGAEAALAAAGRELLDEVEQLDGGAA